MAGASFTGPGGQPPDQSIRLLLHTLSTPTVGDLLYAGQLFRSRIRQRTFRGLDVNGAPFAPYSTKGPYYFYPNAGTAGSVRGMLAPTDAGMLAEVKHARRTASANRYKRVKGEGAKRTPFGIRFENYAAAKAAHGASAVNLYGMEQHTHMLDTMLVQAGGAQIPPGDDMFDLGSDLAAFEQNQPCNSLTLGFYGPEAERARGHNEGNSRLPARRFFDLSGDDLALAEKRIAERMEIRAREQLRG